MVFESSGIKAGLQASQIRSISIRTWAMCSSYSATAMRAALKRSHVALELVLPLLHRPPPGHNEATAQPPNGAGTARRQGRQDATLSALAHDHDVAAGADAGTGARRARVPEM